MQRVVSRDRARETRGGETKGECSRGASSESDGRCDRGEKGKRVGFEKTTRTRTRANERKFTRGIGKVERKEKRLFRRFRKGMQRDSVASAKEETESESERTLRDSKNPRRADETEEIFRSERGEAERRRDRKKGQERDQSSD